MTDVVGSVRKFTVEGTPYRVKADADFSHIISNFENSMLPTSGSAMRKMEKRIPAVESIVLITNGAEQEEIKAYAENPDLLKFSYTTAGGDTYRCQGAIEVENKNTFEGQTNVKVLPVNDWTSFVN